MPTLWTCVRALRAAPLFGTLLLAALQPVAHAADSTALVARGRQLFQACAACHSTQPGGAGLGPSLAGIVGRPAASVPGFTYSHAMKNAHLTWTQQKLLQYLADPQAVVPGNRMPYAGMPDANDRAALAAYLGTLK